MLRPRQFRVFFTQGTQARLAGTQGRAPTKETFFRNGGWICLPEKAQRQWQVLIHATNDPAVQKAFCSPSGSSDDHSKMPGTAGRTTANSDWHLRSGSTVDDRAFLYRLDEYGNRL